eukprot:GHVQ01028705.1.p1 GENE.GHVQ01028705.1~~GHVQ01028705.1.p1  ORF type:complete len:175 (-),score=21.00 GHVQ01028705.1:40-564(-)
MADPPTADIPEGYSFFQFVDVWHLLQKHFSKQCDEAWLRDFTKRLVDMADATIVVEFAFKTKTLTAGDHPPTVSEECARMITKVKAVEATYQLIRQQLISSSEATTDTATLDLLVQLTAEEVRELWDSAVQLIVHAALEEKAVALSSATTAGKLLCLNAVALETVERKVGVVLY